MPPTPPNPLISPPPPASPRFWQVSRSRRLDLTTPAILAILNITPDSFSDGGRFATAEDAAAAALAAVQDGAHAIDIGGESTRPGAERIDAAEQIRRVVPVIRAIRTACGPHAEVPITIDTTLAPVAAAALDAGADAINDVAAGTEDPDLLPLTAERGAGVILMHRLRPPGVDSYSDRYQEPPVYPRGVVEEVREFLSARVAAARAAGVSQESIVIDPGLGFGKTVEQNLELIRRTAELAAMGYPVLSGLSRKSFVARAAGMDSPQGRSDGSLGLSVVHLMAGASIFRVHDVGPHARALRAAAAARALS